LSSWNHILDTQLPYVVFHRSCKEDIEPPAEFIRLRITLRIYMFNKMNTPNITPKDIGNGNKKEIVRLIPNDIPSQTNWL